MNRSIALSLGLTLSVVASACAGDPSEVPRYYPHKSITSKSFGAGAKSYWIIEPAEPTPDKAPVVVFHHGWLAINPGVYGAWIEHLARSGGL